MANPASALAELIAGLASTDAVDRAAAARELYRRGRTQADAALDHSLPGWRESADLAALMTGPPTVGVAVRPETFEKIRGTNGSPNLAEVPPDQDAREFELHFPTEVSLDILSTRAPGGHGAIARYLEKFGEGIQQVEYATTDVGGVTEQLRRRFGLMPIYPKPQPGTDGTQVNFFLLSAPDHKKVLIEFVQPGA